MGPELFFAINQTVIETTALILKLAKKVQEVRHFKTKCEILVADVRTLNELLQRRNNAVKSMTTVTAMQGCFKRIEEFVNTCSSFNFIQTSWQVFVMRQYPALCNEISNLKGTFLIEGVAEILKREDVNLEAINQYRDTVRDAVVGIGKEPKISGSDPTFGEDLVVQFADGSESVGSANITGFGQVVCYALPRKLTSFLSREKYKRIQDGAFVQRYFGTVQQNDRLYAVMEDLRTENTLAQGCEAQTLPKGMIDRIQLAYDVARSMAWFHREQLLLKSTSDHTIILRTLPSGRSSAVLIRLENARDFLEETTGIQYDVRFEAPEYAKAESARFHTRYTDVWSLGVVIWQCVTGKHPWGFAKSVNQTNPLTQDFKLIQNGLRSGKLPNTGQVDILPYQIERLIDACWKQLPQLRPTAAEVAESLQDYIISSSWEEAAAADVDDPLREGENMAMTGIDDDTIIPAMKLIWQARQLNHKSVILLPVSSRLSRDKYQQIISGDEWEAVKYFIVGALIFWDLTEIPIREHAVLRADEVSALHSTFDAEEERASLALQYLEYALSRGYEEAVYEMYKAHALLARKLSTRASKFDALNIL